MDYFGTMKSIVRIDVRKATKEITSAFKDVNEANTRKAVGRAINHTLEKVKTQANKNIRQIYKMPADEVRNRIFVMKSSNSNMTGKVLASVVPLPLSVFNPIQVTGSVATKKAGSYRNASGRKVATYASSKSKSKVIGVWVQVLIGQKKIINSAFIGLSSKGNGQVKAFGKYGPTGFDFKDPGESKQQTLNSKSVFWAFKSSAVSTPLENFMRDEYRSRLNHELMKGLKYARESTTSH